MAYIIVVKNTDRSDPNYEFHRLQSYNSVVKYVRNFRAKKSKEYAFPAAANGKLPLTQQNFHKRVCYAYEIPYGLSIKREAARLAKEDTPYTRGHTRSGDYRIRAIYKFCTEVEIEE